MAYVIDVRPCISTKHFSDAIGNYGKRRFIFKTAQGTKINLVN